MTLFLAHNSVRAADGNDLDTKKRTLIGVVENVGEQNRRRPPTCSPKLSNSQILCLTTSHSFKKQVLDKIKKIHYYYWQLEPKQVRARDGSIRFTTPRIKEQPIPYYPLIITSVQRDKCYLEKGLSSKTLQLLKLPFFRNARSLNSNVHTHIISGTLLTTGLTDIVHYLSLMARSSWRDHPVLRNWTDSEAVALKRRQDKLVRDRKVKEEDSQDIIQRFKLLIKKVILQFTPESNFLGTRPVVRLPPNHYAEIACQHSVYQTERLA